MDHVYVVHVACDSWGGGGYPVAVFAKEQDAKDYCDKENPVWETPAGPQHIGDYRYDVFPVQS